jgi:uncharacterized repeat protein (TIGR01451 family)
MTKWFVAAVSAALGVACVSAVHAQQSNPIETRLEARRVVLQADGKEAFAGAEAARPGDVIEYTATYRNVASAPVRNLEATLPIPANTELVEASPTPAGVRASTDARSFEALPLKRKVRRGGIDVDEVVPPRDIRYLRWYPGELPPGRTLSFKARVRVLDDRPATGPPTGKAAAK